MIEFKGRFNFVLGLTAWMVSTVAFADAALWQDVARTSIAPNGAAFVQPTRSRSLTLDFDGFKTLLKSAPLERETAAANSSFEIALPKVDGSFERFTVVESPIMEPGLARKYPQFRTYLGQSIDDASATVRFDLTQFGLRAQILSWRGTSYIEPMQRGDTTHYLAFLKNDLPRTDRTFSCGVQSGAQEPMNFQKRGVMPKVSSGATLRTHRLAMAATGEYTAALGGTVADGLAGIVTTMNRVNGIYEREVSIRMVLVANTDLLIFTNAASDPYANTSGDLAANQTTVTNTIGSANYDIGHLVGTGGGGVAALGSVCAAGSKAQGLTGSGSPIGDAFDVDYVAHEMGHQYAGNHTFNGNGINCSGANRNGPTAYEPGSGITIQAYAGICGADNLQPNSEDYFHRVSLNEILTFTTTGGGTCGTTSATGNSPPAVPTISSPAGLTIPINTPFELNASTTDPNGDTLSYIWEQFDLTGQQTVAGDVAQLVAGPLFRGFDPKPTGNRQLYPSLRYILNNANQPSSQVPIEGTSTPNFFSGERLPTTTRTLNFRITARDNRAGGGGTNEASFSVATTTAAGPFAVTAPNATGISLAAGSATTMTWNVAGTTAAPVSTANVRILLSRDGGYTFPIVLAASTANDGSESITLPAGTPASTQGRIRIEAVGNIYFDINDNNFTITGSNTAPSIAGTGIVTVRQGGPSVTNATLRMLNDMQTAASALSLSLGEIPRDLNVSVSNIGGNVSATASATCNAVSPATAAGKAYPILLNVTDADGAVTADLFNVFVTTNRAPTIGNYSNPATLGAPNSVSVSPSALPIDPDGNGAVVSVAPTVLPGGGTITAISNGDVTISSTVGTALGTYVIEVTVTDSCGAAEKRRFSVTISNSNPVLDSAVASVLTGNGSIEPNECNQLNIAVTNSGAAAATAVSAVLSSSTPGVSVTQASASYPNIAAAGSASNITPFEVSTSNALVCASTANFTLTLSYTGGGSPAALPVNLTVGNTPNLLFNQNFDGVTAPALPSGWTTQSTGATPPALFATTTAAPNSTPNVAFTNGVATVASNSLISPAIAIPSGAVSAVLSFRHAFNFEASGGSFWDGGIVEISTNGGSTYTNILALGASFSSGGYTGTVNSGFSNPIGGQSAWSGVQASYGLVSATLPVSLNGQNIRIRFRAGWDSSTVNTNPNWRIDDVQLQAGVTCPGPGNGQCGGTPSASIVVAPLSALEDGASNLVYTVGLSSSVPTARTVNITTGGTASDGSDYTGGVSSVTIPANTTSATITIDPTADSVVEANETVILGISAGTGYTVGTPDSATATITNDDSATVQFAPISVSQSEAASPLAFTVTLSNPVASGVSLTVNSTVGTATSPADFTAITAGTISFAANSTTAQTVNVSVANDALDEDDENFTLTLSNLVATGNVTLGSASASGTIQDDDALPVLSAGNVTQAEGDTVNTLNFTVNLSPVSGRAVSFTRATTDGTAISTGPGADFAAIAASTVTIPAGQTSLTIPVTINGDTAFEANESFSLNLSAANNATPSTLSATATLSNDDQQATTTTITSDQPDASVVGENYTVNVTVAALITSPLGTVSITDGTGATCGPLTLSPGGSPNSTASCALSSTSAGNKTLTATYVPASSAFATSTDTEAHTVNAAATTLSLSGPSTARLNTSTSYSVNLQVSAPGAGVPAGTVSINNGTGSQCQITFPSVTPSCNLSFPNVGTQSISASFVPSNGDFSGATSSTLQALVFALADLSVSKSNAVTTYSTNDLLVYTIVLSNLGADPARNVRLQDLVPTTLNNVAWTCSGADCPAAAGVGNIDHLYPLLPSGSQLSYVLSGSVVGLPQSISNTANIQLPADGTVQDPNSANNSATDTDRPELLLRDGFEAQAVNAPSGSISLATALSSLGRQPEATAQALARAILSLDDSEGEALRVYARVLDGQLQLALAARQGNSLKLGYWQIYAEPSTGPTLTWTAIRTGANWRLQQTLLQ